MQPSRRHRRRQAGSTAAGGIQRHLGSALRKTWREGYSVDQLRSDVLAGLVVGIVALPLSMALAIASGVAPQHGLYTAIVAGGLIAITGGSRVQVSGPTAAFVVLLAPVSARYGIGGLATASLLAGAILVGLGAARLGRLIQFVPYPVTAGFTAGIGVVIATLQLRDFFHLDVTHWPETYLGRVEALVQALPTAAPWESLLGAFTLALLLVWRRSGRIAHWIPGPLGALVVASVVAGHLPAPIDTIASRYGGVPRTLPALTLPWHLPAPDGAPLGLSWELVRALLPTAFAMALLGAIESLLSAVIADGMIRRQHDPDAELVGQGLGNLVAPFFGGFMATGAIARTATNVRAGGRSPVAAVVHAALILAAMVVLAPLLGRLPMSSLAALLLLVAWNMSEPGHVVRLIRTAPRSDVLVLLVCFLLTVVFDMVLAVSVGVVLAAILFMRRMAEVVEISLVSEPQRLGRSLPPGVVVYQIAGPLFFGAARRAVGALAEVGSDVRTLVLDLRGVTILDASGLANLESAVSALRDRGVRIIVGGLRANVLQGLLRAGWSRHGNGLDLVRSFDRALQAAEGVDGVEPEQE